MEGARRAGRRKKGHGFSPEPDYVCSSATFLTEALFKKHTAVVQRQDGAGGVDGSSECLPPEHLVETWSSECLGLRSGS